MTDSIVRCCLDSFKEFQTVNDIFDTVVQRSSNTILFEADIEQLIVILDQYQEQPHLLDPHLEQLVTKLFSLIKSDGRTAKAFHQCFKYLYLLTKVRGYKYITRLFPHEVTDLEFIIKVLQNQTQTDHQTWETRYILLLWLAITCIIPFDLKKLDGFSNSEDVFIKKVLDVSLKYLSVRDKCKDAAAYLIAKFLTRPDLKSDHLPEFLNWALNIVDRADIQTMNGVNEISGILSTFGLIFKHGRREDLLFHGPRILECIDSLGVFEIENTVIRKVAVKVAQRVGLTFLRPKIAAWRYYRGSRSLSQNLNGKNDLDVGNKNLPTTTSVEDETYDIPEEVETILDLLITGLKDKDTIVRWSAAKGVGRITSRLPLQLADEVVGSLLELFTYSELDGAWHGGCLALAELGRRGLLLPSRLKGVVAIVLRALTYDERRGSFSVGSHVRDAACYVCWSFARAYEAEIIRPFVLDIASALLLVTLFDREVNCRRAASAAFQENVGRQGTFPHGIDILTAADYFTVGNRTHCYNNLSVFVASFPQYTNCLIDHLFQEKISHWDSAIRELAASALFSLTKIAPEYMLETVVPSLVEKLFSIDINTKHGSILSLSEVLHALYLYHNNQSSLFKMADRTLNAIKSLVSTLQATNQFRGAGGELMRKAICKMIENMAISELSVSETRVLDEWLFLMEDTIPHTDPVLQEAAIVSLSHFCVQYIKGSPHFVVEEIIKRYCKHLMAKSKFYRMGYSLALGGLPAFMLQNKLGDIIKCLLNCMEVDENKVNAGLYAEARSNCIKALCRICKTVGIGSLLCMTEEIFQHLFDAMNDYTMDSRGDVGAWVRESAMTTAVEISLLMAESDREVDEALCGKIACGLLQQSCEKIDRTRSHAGNLLLKFIYSRSLPIPCLDALRTVLTRDMLDTFNWSASAETFKVIGELLHLKEYQYFILLGLTTSMGGLTESIVRHSSDHFLAYLSVYRTNTGEIDHVMNNLLKILKNHKKNDRIIMPLLKVLDLIFYSGSLQIYADENKSTSFPSQLFDLLKEEMKGCADAKKLLSSIIVFCSLLQFPDEVRRKSLQQLMMYLCHKYPRIRRATAEQLYTTFLTYDDVAPDECLDEVTAKLTDTAWDGPIEVIRETRNEICVLLNIPQPKRKKTATATQTPAVRIKDDLDSYQDLVTRHGF